MDRVSAGEADEHLELIFGRMDQSAGLTIVRLASESDINFTPYSLVDAEESWSRCWNYCALKANRFNLPCIDITWNGSGPQRWETVDLRSELYSSFGGDFYLANGKATGYGSAAEVLARIALTQAEAQERGKAFTISEWGIWSGRGITSTQAVDFVQALWDLLVTFPDTGPGALLYWNHFWGKTDVSLRGWPLAYQLWRDLLIGEA